jgi:hypothetical protein
VKDTKLIDFEYLSELGHKTQILPPDKASPLLLEARECHQLDGNIIMREVAKERRYDNS